MGELSVGRWLTATIERLHCQPPIQAQHAYTFASSTWTLATTTLIVTTTLFVFGGPLGVDNSYETQALP